MPGAWEIKNSRQVFAYTIHVETTTVAWAMGLRSLIIPGIFTGFTGMPFDHARNAAVQQFLQSPYEWLFSLDSDVVCPPDTILRLLAHNRPIVSGMYLRRSPPHGVPVMIKDGNWVTNFQQGSMVEVDLVGAGCLLVHRSVFEKVPPQRPGKPWFDWKVDLKGTGVAPEELCMSEDFSWCFPKGTWVAGLHSKPIEQVKLGDRVITHRGSLRKVLDTSVRHYSGEMIRVTARHLGVIESTPGHRYYVKTTRKTGRKQLLLGGSTQFGGVVNSPCLVEMATKKTDWVEAKDIRVGDWLYVPKARSNARPYKRTHLSHHISLRSLTKFSDGMIGYSRTRKDALRIPSAINITPELCRLLGYYIAEGSCGKKKHVVGFGFNIDEKDTLAADCARLLKSVFGAESTMVFPKAGKGMGLYTSSKVLARLFSALCGNGSRNKHLPNFWAKLSKPCLRELIKGYWWGDGCCSGGGFTAVTTSQQLAREIQAALLRLGILCGFGITDNKHQFIYNLRIPLPLAQRFADLVGYKGHFKEAQLEYMQETDAHFLVKVAKTEKFDFDGEVYNLKVAGVESYTANGAAVHNCTWVRKHGYRVFVDTSIACKHIGLAEAVPGNMIPLQMPAVA